MQAQKPNKLEARGYAILKELGLKYNSQYILGKRFVVDAYVPRYNLVVQFDGDYWHGNREVFPVLRPSQLKQCLVDQRQDEMAKKLGLNVIRFWETDIHKHSDDVKNRLKTLTGVKNCHEE
jgi:very-short-patch-repair endonuclease